MSPEEAFRLCRMVKALCPAQSIDELSPDGWALVLRDDRYTDAEQALAQLAREQEFIHVSHIVGRMKRIRRDRVLAFGTLPDPPSDLDPNDTDAYSRWLVATTRAIADGTLEPPQAVKGPKRDVIRELGQIGKEIPDA